MRRPLPTALATLFAFLLVACTRSAQAPTPAPGAPVRVVALSPGVADIMRDLGQGDVIVGRHASDEWSDSGLPVCGDQVAGVDYEQLLRVAPTHVFLQAGEVPQRLRDMAAARGFLVENLSILSLDEIRLTARRFSAWDTSAGPLPADPPRADIENMMDRAWGRLEGWRPDRVGNVLLLASVDPPGALGPGSWHHDILQRLGATPAIDTGSAYVMLDAEDILRLAPDAIILFAPRAVREPDEPTSDVRSMLGRIGELDIPAVRNDRLALIDDPKCHLPSTAMIGVANQMAEVLRAWSP